MQSIERHLFLSGGKLFAEGSELIGQNQQQVAVQANRTLILLFRHAGRCIHDEILQNQQREYGKQWIPELSARLKKLSGRNFTKKNGRGTVQLATLFSNREIVVTLSQQLSWPHFLVLIPLKSPEARQFCAELAIEETLGMRDLRKQIADKASGRTGTAGIRAGQNENFPVDTFQDPCLPDFPGLQNGYREKENLWVLQRSKRTPGASENMIITKRKCGKKKPIF